MAYLSPVSLGQIFRPSAPGQGFGMSAETQNAQEQGRRQDLGRRSIFSTVTQRIGTIRGMNRDAMREREGTRLDRLLQEINRMRDAAIGPTGPFQGHPDSAVDLEAQATGGNGGTGGESSGRRGNNGKSRREKEEAAALFGPNLANYFGSGSSSSGAVISSIGNGDNFASMTASQKKSRLGSRGRARGASLSGLSIADAFGEVSHPAQDDQSVQNKGSTGSETITMAEGIEIDTIKRWIDRSVMGGALEVSNADNAAAASVETAGASNLCSTLQSYVNLKRNTVKLNVHSEGEDGILASRLTTPSPTHLLQFEYDCASPFAGIQVFARASRKHGSWVNWAAAREAMGLSSDSCLDSASADIDSLFYAQRGPPPHVLGWPIYTNRLTRGFGKPLKAGVALQLDFYAPPKSDHGLKRREEVFGSGSGADVETPGLEAGKRLGEEPTTPAATTVPVSDPMSRVETNAFPPAPASSVAPAVETKEAKTAREKAERETLKLTIIVEALDEDGKPLMEPNLQTTYLRVASLPLRSQEQGAVLDASNIIVDGREGGPVQDVALPAKEEEEGREILADGPFNGTGQFPTRSSSRRVWSLQVEGQEAEIGPHRFQLQELYGLSSRPPPPQQENHQDQDIVEGDADNPAPILLDYNQERAQSECLICLSAPPTTLLLPCTHGLCLECAVQLRESVKTVRQTERRRGRRPKRKYACPVCRRAYTNMLHLSTADEKKVAQANAAIA